MGWNYKSPSISVGRVMEFGPGLYLEAVRCHHAIECISSKK